MSQTVESIRKLLREARPVRINGGRIEPAAGQPAAPGPPPATVQAAAQTPGVQVKPHEWGGEEKGR